MEKLIEELKQHLIEELNLEDITPADIDAEAPLLAMVWGWIRLMRWRLS